MRAKLTPSLQARDLLIIISVVYVLLVAGSLSLNLMSTRQRYEELSLAVARSIFQQFVAVRTWSAQHGGVYLQTNEDLGFDPDLKDTSGKATTADGRVLTRVHPEYVTRLISDILTAESGVKIGVTSLKLTSADNAPDAWEKAALEKFDKGGSEQHAIVQMGQVSAFRYMAPLKTEESCMGCHGRQGHTLGDIRGGLSVTFSYAPFQKAIRNSYTYTYAVHALFLFAGLTIMFVLGRKLVRRIVEVQESSARIKRLEGLLPICAGCKKIKSERADPSRQDSWIPVEVFISGRTDADFTHSLCPECVKKLYGREYGE